MHACWQACRGKKYDWGVDVADSDDTDSASDASTPSVRKVPIEADCLFAYSVVPGKSATNASRYIVLRKHSLLYTALISARISSMCCRFLLVA